MRRNIIDKMAIIPAERIESRIYLRRGQKVMVSGDLAVLYGVPARQLNQAVARNSARFPNDFVFRLSKEEARNLRSQTVILKRGTHLKYLPYAFTEQGVAMLSAVLRSPTAIAVSIEIIRVFVRLRRLLASNAQLRRKLEDLERKLQDHDAKFAMVFEAIRQIMDEDEEPRPSKPPIGFHTEEHL